MGKIPTINNVPDADILSLRERFVAKMWKGLLLLAVLSWPITFWRIHTLGWQPLFGFHLALASAVGIAALGQRLLSFKARAALLFGTLWAVGAPGLFSFGPAAPGTLWLVLSCLVATTVYSVRAGALVALATGLLYLLAGWGFVTGRLHSAIDADTYLSSASSWGVLIVVTGIFSTLVLQSFAAFMHANEQLLVRVKQQRDEIEHLSLHDSLTGLPMASLANDRIDMAMRAARRAGKYMALLFVDLDGFKRVNDGMGHDAGDAVLKLTATRMLDCLRGEDTVARIGGDEFLVIIGNVGHPAQAARVAEKLIRVIGQTIELAGRQVQVGASIGIALYPQDAADVQGLRHQADQAMYEAKRQGRNRYQFLREPGDMSGSDSEPR